MRKAKNDIFFSQKGFTLIELLVVMVIISLVAGLVAFKFWPQVDRAKQKAAKTQIEIFESALDALKLDVGRYPTTQEGLIALRRSLSGFENWNGPYVDEQLPLDPWGNKYQYIFPGEHGDFDLISYGADGRQGGEKNDEDIVSWKNIGQEDREYY